MAQYSGIKFATGTSERAGMKALNNLCREQMIKKLLADILMDLTVCELEGFDKKEYILRLKAEIDHFAERIKEGKHE